MSAPASKFGRWVVVANRQMQGSGFRYAASMVACHMLNGVAGVLAMRWLTPMAVGWWNTAQMAKVPLDAARMGILNGMNREYPFLIGEGKPELAQRTLETGLAHTLLMLGLCQVAVAGAVVFMRDEHPMLVAGILATSLVWSFAYYTQFVRSMLRTQASFGIAGSIELAVTAFDVVAVVAVWHWGYYGLIGRAVLTAGLTAAVFRHFQPVRVSVRFDWAALRRMFNFGRHTFLTNYINLVGQQAERILLLAAADGVRMLGLYTPAILCASFLQVVPGAFQNYFYPRLVEAFGRNADVATLTTMLFTQMRRAMLAMVPVSLAAAVGIVVLIRTVLPHYREGELAAVIVCLAGPFYPFRMCASYYAARHRWRDYYIYSAVQTILPFAAIWAFQLVAPALEGVALGYVAANIGAGALLVWLTRRHAVHPAEATPLVT